MLTVFWWLKLVGITLAGEAFCGITEHTHDAVCTDSGCTLTEHTHIATCYSDITADLETADDWEATLENLSSGLSSGENVVAVAKSQLGYCESELNFTVDSNGIRHGYTRYGEWYGNPYGEWSTMFTSFCLRYAGLADAPINSGADAMRLQWQESGMYQSAGDYTPLVGDIVFLDKNANGSADATAVITEVSDSAISVIEGDLENRVGVSTYNLTDNTVLGYGVSAPGSTLFLLNATDSSTVIAKTTAYNQSLFTEENSFVLYTANGSDYYAFDGSGNAVQIYIDSNGNITSDVSDPNSLLWSFTSSGGTNSYLIKNVSTGKYMHAYPNNGSGVITSGAYPSVLVTSGSGVKIRSNSEYAYLNVSQGAFKMTQNVNSAAVYRFGVTSKCTIWLDGTNGGLMSLGGSVNKSYTVEKGGTIKLPTEWQSPEKYNYKLQGWYDVKNNKYYTAGEEITVTDNTVLYADWVAESYDVGKYNSFVSDTVSTNDFIETHVFDYSSLFNVLSQRADVTANASGHSETWNLLTSGNSPYSGQPTLDFIFSDYDQYGVDISYPKGLNDRNTNGDVFAGLYTPELDNIVFGTDNGFDPVTKTGIIGKKHLGTADHLFKYMTDPTDPNYGYYYYDSSLNAASFNQTDKRFYVYDYLERTADSAKDGGAGEYSDFLPFNSPYANMNGKTVASYTYAGKNGEYQGTTHCQYDAKYNTNNNSVNNVGTNYWFGMTIDIDFYLPNDPGSTDEGGNYGNQDLYGKDMHFKFSGDDDVWVLLDGKLVLDIGGVHGVESGDINFSTGVITLNGTRVGTLDGVKSGEHILTIHYLERGSSQSNCAIYFNLAPRYEFTIQKEDVLTGELLNGAEFSVYTDKNCTQPAALWTSRQEHVDNKPTTNVFTVKNGVATIWGMGAGQTYYIRETKPPDADMYSMSNGVICVSLDKRGEASYSVEIIEDTGQNGQSTPISNGFTVHGFKIDEETQKAYIVVTNAQDWVTETTTVQVLKKWNDKLDHTYDSVTAYLTVTDPDKTVRRIREITLNNSNNWEYIWTNLPKYASDGVTEIVYGIEEAYNSGYYSSVEKIEEIVIETQTWAEAYSFDSGGTYILKTASGCLATNSSGGLYWLDEETAKTSPSALWETTVSGSNIRFKNKSGYILSLNAAYWGSNNYFYATTGSATSQNLRISQTNSGLRLYSSYNNRSYYLGSLNSNGRATATTSSGSGLTFTPMHLVTQTTVEKVENFAFKVTNTPLEEETALTVFKEWDIGNGTAEIYEREQVTIKLFANGKDTGRTVTLSLKNNWRDTFMGLPYTDENGDVIKYTVEESWDTEDWLPTYGEIRSSNSDPPTYETTVTNVYRWGHGYEMPATNGRGVHLWILSGMGIMLISLVLGYILRRKRERRFRH